MAWNRAVRRPLITVPSRLPASRASAARGGGGGTGVPGAAPGVVAGGWPVPGAGWAVAAAGPASEPVPVGAVAVEAVAAPAVVVPSPAATGCDGATDSADPGVGAPVAVGDGVDAA